MLQAYLSLESIANEESICSSKTLAGRLADPLIVQVLTCHIAESEAISQRLSQSHDLMIPYHYHLPHPEAATRLSPRFTAFGALSRRNNRLIYLGKRCM